MQLHLVALVCCLACCYVVVYLAFLRAVPHSVAGGFVAVKVLRALVKWNSSGTFLDCSDSFLSNSIGLAKPNKCQQRLCDLWPAQMFCLAMLPDLIRFSFLCWPTKQFVTLFSIAEKSSSSREGNLLPTTVFWDCSLFLALSTAYTSIIQMRSQQKASSCGLSRGLAQAALNPFSAFAFAFTFALLCFGCIYLALCLEALPLREAGSRAARGSASL